MVTMVTRMEILTYYRPAPVRVFKPEPKPYLEKVLIKNITCTMFPRCKLYPGLSRINFY